MVRPELQTQFQFPSMLLDHQPFVLGGVRALTPRLRP
jgi:hypothetical protein